MTTRKLQPSLSERVEAWGPLLIVLSVLGLWETLVRTGAISPTFFPRPTAVVGALVAIAASGELLIHAWATMARVLLGFAAGASLGLLVGLAMGASPRLHRQLDPIVALLHPIPKISVLPLILVVFGIGETSKIVLAALGSFFPMLISTVSGVRQINPTYFEVARSCGAGRWHTFTRVILPGSLPSVLTGGRIAVNLAVMLTIAGEFVVSQRGLGHIMWFSWQTLRIADVYAWLAVTGAIGTLLNWLLSRLANRAMPWQEPAARAGGTS